MSEQKLENIVDELTAELAPVKVLPHPLARILPWLAAAAVYVFALAQVFGIRPDLSPMLHEGAFVFETGLGMALALSAALAAAWLAVPDMRGRGWIVIPALALLTVFVLWCTVRGHLDGFYLPHDGWHVCATHALMLGALPVAGLILLSRQGATVRPRLMALMNIVAVGALGWLTLRYTCPSEDAGHIFFYHLAPFAVVGGVLAALAQRLYRW